MRLLGCHLSRGLALFGLVALSCASVLAQNKPRPAPPPEKMEANHGVKQGQPNLRGLAGLPPKWVENLAQMSPEQQERFMQNNERFKNLPPERQQQIRRRLQQWNNLTPEQRDAFMERERVLESMTPAQRAVITNQILPKWKQLPPDRRKVIGQRLTTLRQVPDAEREELLNDPKFLRGLSPDEQDLLRNLNTLRNPPESPNP